MFVRDLLLSDQIILKKEDDDLTESFEWPENFEFPLATKQVAYVTTEAIRYDQTINIKFQNSNAEKFEDEELEKIETLVDDRSYTNKEVFETQKHMTYDPFNNRVKIFNKDFTFRVPQKMGYIYEFDNKRALIYDSYKKVCQEVVLEDLNSSYDKKQSFYKSLRLVWT